MFSLYIDSDEIWDLLLPHCRRIARYQNVIACSCLVVWFCCWRYYRSSSFSRDKYLTFFLTLHRARKSRRVRIIVHHRRKPRITDVSLAKQDWCAVTLHKSRKFSLFTAVYDECRDKQINTRRVNNRGRWNNSTKRNETVRLAWINAMNRDVWRMIWNIQLHATSPINLDKKAKFNILRLRHCALIERSVIQMRSSQILPILQEETLKSNKYYFCYDWLLIKLLCTVRARNSLKQNR